ncbi:MAG: hypothetical protein KatS3mg025_0128 [Bacteroidia bacterium]|jgi:CRISPR-associated protein Cmr5|nr:MAG: hypothetical protein KatS3mg025_0128 [Bacteroidia bacterium]
MKAQLEFLARSRAAHAHAAIQALLLKRRAAKEYKGLIRRFPSLVRTAGLGQALAFLASKASSAPERANNPHHWLANTLWDWWRQSPLGPSASTAASFLDWIVRESTLVTYRKATQEVLAYLFWLKRFAEAFIPDETTHE